MLSIKVLEQNERRLEVYLAFASIKLTDGNFCIITAGTTANWQ